MGAFVSNTTSGVSPGVASAIAVGNTLAAVTGVYLLRRVDFRPSLDRAVDILWLTLLGAFAATTISATNGVTTLAVAGSAAATPYGSAWLLWWTYRLSPSLLAPLFRVMAERYRQLMRA